MQLLDEIIQGAIDEETSLPVLLRKCLLLSHQLKNEKLKLWAESELNGYPDAELLPKYRICRIVAKGAFYGPGGAALNDQPLAPASLEKDFRHWAETAYLTQPIAAYDTGKDARGVVNGGNIEWPPNLVAHVSEHFFPGWNMVRAHQVLPGSLFAALMDTVRNRILQLALELKDELGQDNLELTEIPRGRVDQSVINNIYGGNIVIAAQAENFAQISTVNVALGDRLQLEAALKSLGLDGSAIAKLEIAMKEDAEKDGGTPTLGPRTLGWIKDAASYTAKEGLKVGFEIAKKTATKWIMQHYGLDI
jgi:hypothetical protein